MQTCFAKIATFGLGSIFKMQKFDKEHIDKILAEFERYSEGRGFRKKRKDKSIREANDGLIHSIDVHFMRRYGELHVTPSLSVLHYDVGPIITASRESHRVMKIPRQREYDATLNLSPIKFIIARKTGTGAISDYTIGSPYRINDSLYRIFSDIDSVMTDFFQAQDSFGNLIEYFENNTSAGGVARYVKLLALYYFTGRYDDLRTLAADLSPDNAAPMTISMKNYLLKKIGEPVPESLIQKKPGDTMPSWPLKLSREERRKGKEREKAFQAALKSKAKKTGWRFAQRTIFKQEGEWFLSNMPCLAYKHGVITRWTCKPMSIDPLFWEIVGLEENNKQPLSFRDQGAWILRPQCIQEYISRDESDPERLAEAVIRWSEEWRETQLPNRSLSSMLSELGNPYQLKGMDRSIAICLSILTENFEQAERLCRDEVPDASALSKDSGGFVALGVGGRSRTFFDQAREWLIKRRRGELKLAD